MLEKTLLIVSDKFKNFTTWENVITQSELYHLLNTENAISAQTKGIRLIPGQGFSQCNISHIISLSKTAKNASFFDFSLWYKIPERASQQLTHKNKIENILISEPKKVSDICFNMDILIDENCEIMDDHQTGLHVQGMLLLEASRQAYLAVFEKYFCSESNIKKYFIFNSMNVNYNHFTFPLPAELSVSIREMELSTPKKQHAIMDMEVIQCNTPCASLSLDISAIPRKRIKLMESKLAKESLDKHIDTIINGVNHSEVAHV